MSREVQGSGSRSVAWGMVHGQNARSRCASVCAAARFRAATSLDGRVSGLSASAGKHLLGRRASQTERGLGLGAGAAGTVASGMTPAPYAQGVRSLGGASCQTDGPTHFALIGVSVTSFLSRAGVAGLCDFWHGFLLGWQRPMKLNHGQRPGKTESKSSVCSVIDMLSATFLPSL